MNAKKNKPNRALRVVLATALTCVMSMTGALSKLPVVGDVFQPLTVRAAEVKLSEGHWYLDGSGNLQEGSSGPKYHVGRDTDIISDTTGRVYIHLYGNKLNCSRIAVSNGTLILEGGNFDIGDNTLFIPAVMAKNVEIRNLSNASSIKSGAVAGIYASDSIYISDTGDGLDVTSQTTGGEHEDDAIHAGTGSVFIAGNVYAEGRRGIVAGADVHISEQTVKAIGIGDSNPPSAPMAYGIHAGGTVHIEDVGNGSWVEVEVSGKYDLPADAIYAGNEVRIINSVVIADAVASTSRGIYSKGNITFSGADTEATVKNQDTTGNYPAILSSNGVITINPPLGIEEPPAPRGVLSWDGRTIMNGQEKATIVKISNQNVPIPVPPTPVQPSSGDCSHPSFQWITLYGADEHNDGMMAYVCGHCGHEVYRVLISGYYIFNKNTAEKIRNAPQGGTISVRTSRWISFNPFVRDALVARPDVTLEVSFLEDEYKGDRHSFTLPAGTDVKSLWNEEGYAGFKYLGGTLGTLTKG